MFWNKDACVHARYCLVLIEWELYERASACLFVFLTLQQDSPMSYHGVSHVHQNYDRKGDKWHSFKICYNSA